MLKNRGYGYLFFTFESKIAFKITLIDENTCDHDLISPSLEFLGVFET